MNEKEFASIFMLMMEYFDAQPSEGLIELYYQLLKDMPYEDFKRACQGVMETRVYKGIPKVGEIKEALYGNIKDRAKLAYHALVKAMRDVGPWATVTFEDGAIGRAVDAMGGWETVNEITAEEWKFRQKEFEEFYMANLKSGRVKPMTLHGAFDRINGASGQKGWNDRVLVTKDMRCLANPSALQIEEKGGSSGEVERKGGE